VIDKRTGERLGVAHRPGESTDLRSIGLPEDLLNQAVRRMSMLAIIVGCVLVVSILMNTLFAAKGVIPMPPMSVALRILGIAGCVAMVLVIRFAPLSPQRKCDLGLGFEVLGAYLLGVYEITIAPEFNMPIGSISIVSLWILVFRMLVPSTSWRAFGAAFLSAATLPLAVWTTEATCHVSISAWVAGAIYKTTFMTALVAWLASRAIYKMGTAVTAARMMGSYKLERLLGKGGMGEVWLGSHAMLKRPAAIKLIQPDRLGATGATDSATRVQRFEREAQATSALHSKHTVHLYDFGTTEDGTFYYVMEYLEGIDVDVLVERYGPVPPERAIFLLRQACHSLMEAHDCAMIHRDIKPGNIRVCRLGPDYDFVKVLDFGLVKHTDGGEQDSGLTVEGVATGTPAYMAPEMALGGELGPPADIYQLGCVAYWLLTGKPVFEAKTAMAVISQHIQDAPAPLSERTELTIPRSLESLVMDCLKKEPADRPQTAREVFGRLDDIELEEPWTRKRAEHWWQVHRPDEDDQT